MALPFGLLRHPHPCLLIFRLLLLLLLFLPLPALGNLAYPDYDALSRVVVERDPLGHESLFRYDLNGNLVWKRDPKGQETVLTYDVLNRLTRVDYADGQWAAFSFDENGNRTEIEGSDGQRVARTFDELDRVRTITHSALDRQLSYEYTVTGARGAFEVRDLQNGLVERTSYEWDQAGRPVAIRPPTGDVVAYRYAPDGAREGATLPNGVDVGYQYDSLGRLVEITYRDPSSREIAFFRYTYSTAGNRTSQVDTEGLTQYTYGALDRLVEARYPDGSFEKFSYDQVGNRLTHEDPDGITSYAYDPGDRLLATTGAKPSSFTWDPNGNMLSKTDPEGTVAYRWNARDRLVRVDLADGASNLYRYLPESDLRFSVTDKTGAETRFVWDGSNVVEELGPSNVRLASYIEGLGVDEHLGRVGADGVVHAYVADPLGTVRAVVDAGGQIQNAYAYKAFGDVRAAVEGIPNPYRFTGRSFEPDTGEYYYRARYYQPGVGRFGAVDRYAPGEETYGYAGGNPAAWRDPFGTESYSWIDAYRPDFWAEGFRRTHDWLVPESYDEYLFALYLSKKTGDDGCPLSRQDISLDDFRDADEYLELMRGLAGEVAACATVTAAGCALSRYNPSFKIAYHTDTHPFAGNWPLRSGRFPHLQGNMWFQGVGGSDTTLFRLANRSVLLDTIIRWWKYGK